MRAAFVVNPAAGRGRALRVWKSLEPVARASGNDITVHYTTAPGEATRLAAEAAAGGAERIIALGGDGTLYEAVNGLVGTKASFGVIPGGTGNDFCRFLRIPKDPVGALHAALGPNTLTIDLGRAWDRYFLNSAGIGFDAAVCQATNAVPKYFGGTIPYLVGVTKVLLQFRPLPVTLEVDGVAVTLPITLIAVANGQYYGGGMHIAPEARFDDGLFDIIKATDLTKPQLLQAVPRLYSGTHLSLPKVSQSRGRRIVVTSDYPIPVHLDGEVAGTLPVTLEVLPAALQVAVPV
ncbi:MAG: diacylglycerol/lipid kinase family protein [Symbiobacteriia bacterium]